MDPCRRRLQVLHDRLAVDEEAVAQLMAGSLAVDIAKKEQADLLHSAQADEDSKRIAEVERVRYIHGARTCFVGGCYIHNIG